MNLTDRARAEKALRDAVSSGRPERVAQAILANVWPLYSFHFDALRAAVEALPGPLLDQNPVLKVLHPMTPVLARVGRPFKPLLSPEDARLMSADEVDVFTLVQMVGFRFSGDVAAALIYARRLEERVVEVRVESHERADGPLWYYHHQVGSTLLAAGETSRALRAFTTARHLARLSLQPDAERVALGRAALAHALRGSLDEANAVLADVDRQPAASRAHASSSLNTERTTAALIAVERMSGDIDERLADLAPFDSIDLTWPFALLARTRACLARQRPDDALEAVRLAGDAHPSQHGSTALDIIGAASIDALWALGEAQSARRIAGSASGAGRLTKLAAIRLALLDARPNAAARGIRELSQDASLGPGRQAELLLLSAWHDFQTGEEVAPETAAHIARLVATQNVRRLVTTIPHQLVDAVRDRLVETDRLPFDAAVAGLTHVDLPRLPALTKSEARVLSALPIHRSTAALAAALHVSPNTIKSQLRSLYRKLGCTNRGDAIEIALRLRLTTLGTE